MILVIIVGLTTGILANTAIDKILRQRARKRLIESYEQQGKFTGFCALCKEKRIFAGETIKTDSGRNLAKGSCPHCGGAMSRILGRA